MFLKIGVLKNYALFTGNHLRLSPADLLKRGSNKKIVEFLRTFFLQHTTVRLFLVSLSDIKAFHRTGIAKNVWFWLLTCQPVVIWKTPIYIFSKTWLEITIFYFCRELKKKPRIVSSWAFTGKRLCK